MLRAVNEIKVMLAGRGGAGKTSLRKFFMGRPHDTKEPETPGIALDSFPLPCAQDAMTVRLWDFAGQEITHALHQFFLTEGCVYVLALDSRSNTEMQDAEYWLGLLQRHAGGAPVLVALNRQDERQGGYDVDRRALKDRFPFVRCPQRRGRHGTTPRGWDSFAGVTAGRSQNGRGIDLRLLLDQPSGLEKGVRCAVCVLCATGGDVNEMLREVIRFPCQAGLFHQVLEFADKIPLPMMLFLPFDVSDKPLFFLDGMGEGSVAFLPIIKFGKHPFSLDPRGTGGLDFLDQIGQRNGGMKGGENVDMVLHSANLI